MTDLKTEVDALKAELAELKEKMKPLEPFVSDYVPPSPNRFLDRASMPLSAMADLVSAIGDGMVREIAKDRYASSPRSAIPGTKPSAAPVSAQNTSGWRDAQPLGPPPGIAQADRLMDAQDARDRAELIAQDARRRKAGG
jgi:hypothetical protein